MKAPENTPASKFPLRQVHLDFHTSPHIPDVGVEFDADAFAETMVKAHVNSVTIFARCHHGMCYYPSKVATVHPALKGRDLMGEMITALHSRNIRCPIYTTLGWDEDLAQKHPEWRMMRSDGTFARVSNPDHTKPSQPGGWYFLDWMHPGYQDFMEAHIVELLKNYDVDGLFLDIMFYEELAHYGEGAMALRRKLGLTAPDRETFKRFESAAQAAFCAKFTKISHKIRPQSSMFYNSSWEMTQGGVGPRCRAKSYTHVEIESLPSGFWGYYHFPRLARGAGYWGRPWIGQTGRFQKMWGDFGGIKPQAALEYECFRSQALGGGNSVGDQLPPRGSLDQAAYNLIGAVFEQCEAAEPFYAGSKPLNQIGVLTANYPGRDHAKSDEGALIMCEESHYETALIDELDDLSKFELVVLPDETVISPELYGKLKAYHRNGGQLIISYRAGRDAAGAWALDFLPLSFEGQGDKYPTYWRAKKSFWAELSSSDRVFYSQGFNVVAGKGTEVLVDRVLPYFKRTDLTFSSHFQAPPVAMADKFPAVVAGKGFVYFADPIFREYREVGNIAVRDVWRRVVVERVGMAPFGAGLPTTILSCARRRGRDLILTLLHYVPLRKALELDVLEERMSFAGEALRLPPAAKNVRVFGSGEVLPRAADGSFTLPVVKGRLLLEVVGYFKG